MTDRHGLSRRSFALAAIRAPVAHGPNVAGAPLAVPALAVSSRPIAEWLKPEGKPLTYRTTGIGRDIVLKPLNESWDRYVVYWKTV